MKEIREKFYYVYRCLMQGWLMKEERVNYLEQSFLKLNAQNTREEFCQLLDTFYDWCQKGKYGEVEKRLSYCMIKR